MTTFTEFQPSGWRPALALEADRVAVYSARDATYELGFLNLTAARASLTSPWVYRIQANPLDPHLGWAEEHAGRFYYAQSTRSFPALILTEPAKPNDIPQFLFDRPSDYWAAQTAQQELAERQVAP